MGPSVARLNGRNMSTVPNERMMSGQKRSFAPVCGLSRPRPMTAVASTTAPTAMRRRGSNFPRRRAASGNAIADASAPGKSSMPVCCAV